MTFTPEQELYLIKQQMAAQQSTAQQGGAITGSGIRAWWMVVAFFITSLVGFCVWLASNSSKATEQFVNITRDIDALKTTVSQMKQPNDVFSLPPRMAAVEERQKEQDKVIIEINKTLGGLPQQFLNLSTDIRNLRDKGGR